MAEEAATPATSAAEGGAHGSAKSGSKMNIIVLALVLVNTIVVGAIAFMVYQAKKAEEKSPGIDAVVRGEIETQHKEREHEAQSVKPIIPLETFVVNLSGSRGRRVAKVSVELELNNLEAKDEVDRRNAQIRDIIIMLLSSKTYESVSTTEGREKLRVEMKDTINAFMSEGKVENIYFTGFIYN